MERAEGGLKVASLRVAIVMAGEVRIQRVTTHRLQQHMVDGEGDADMHNGSSTAHDEHAGCLFKPSEIANSLTSNI